MADAHVRYQNPPAREAVCELRFPKDNWDAAIPGLIYVQLKDVFSERANATQVVFGSLGSPVPAMPVEVVQVTRFVQADGLAFVQFSPNVISIHRMAPYPGWNIFSPLIRRVFDAYVTEAKAARVERIGLRFVNDFRETVRDAVFEPAHYFNFYPQVGPELPQEYGDVFTRVVFPFPHEGAALRMQLYSDAIVNEGRASIVLDLDYFLANGEGCNVDEVPAWLDKGHKAVRSVFEASLTPKLRELLHPIPDPETEKAS
jgi:uncharacterized protein (TIGR04255 family)